MSHRQAMLCALGGFFSWVLVDVAIKLSSEESLSPFTIMTVLGSVGATSVFISAAFKKNLSLLVPHSRREQAIIALCSVAMNYFLIIALKHLPLTVFYIVVFTTPLVIAAFSALLKYETLTPIKIGCVIAGFIGVVIAVGTNGGGDWIGYMAGLVNVIGFAIFTILMRKISKTDTMESIQFLNTLSVMAVGLACSLPLTTAMDIKPLAAMILAGGLNLFGNVLYNKALQNTVSTNVAQLHYTQIISGALLGYLIWHEVPTWNLILGSILIIASGIMVAAQAQKAEVENLSA